MLSDTRQQVPVRAQREGSSSVGEGAAADVGDGLERVDAVPVVATVECSDGVAERVSPSFQKSESWLYV